MAGSIPPPPWACRSVPELDAQPTTAADEPAGTVVEFNYIKVCVCVFQPVDGDVWQFEPFFLTSHPVIAPPLILCIKTHVG